MSRVVHIAASSLFVVAAYIGWPHGSLIGYCETTSLEHLWIGVLIALGAVNLSCALWLRRADSARALAGCGLAFKLCLTPLFLSALPYATWVAMYILGGPSAFLLALILMFPTLATAYGIMLITSSYGFTAVRRAREQGLIAADTARLHTRMHMIPLADLISAAKLYALLRDTAGAHEEPASEA